VWLSRRRHGCAGTARLVALLRIAVVLDVEVNGAVAD
jgi:hypothetical protein